MRIPGIPFYPAHASNYTKGRVRPIRKITIHHSAGWEATLRYLWADPSRNGSSTFWVGDRPNQIEQYVDTDDTPWTNGNLASNQESLTIEVRGDWRGFFSQSTLNNLEILLQKLRKIWPEALIEYHMDVSSSSTLCPADLKHKGYARQVWDKVTAWLKPPTPPKPSITYQKITPKRIRLIRVANLWNFNFTDWGKAQAVQSHGLGHLVDVVAIATNSLGAKYYMTAYSYDEGRIRATNGFNVADCEDYVPAITQPPTVELKWEPMATKRKLKAARDLYVTNLDTMANQGELIKAGTEIEFVEKKTLANHVMYLRSKWAFDNKKNWGIRMDALDEIVEVPREPVPEPPLDVDPEEPGSGDPKVVDKNIVIAFLESIVKLITSFIDSLRK